LAYWFVLSLLYDSIACRHCKCFPTFLQIFLPNKNANTPQGISIFIISSPNDEIGANDDEIENLTKVEFCVKLSA